MELNPKEPRPTEVVAARWRCREPCGYWLAKHLSRNLHFSFLNRISLLLISGGYPIVLTRLGGPITDPIVPLPQKFLGYSRESNLGPLRWQSYGLPLYQTGSQYNNRPNNNNNKAGTLTISDQRSCIKIETLCGKNHTEIHSALSEVCGEFTVDRSIVSRWANHFRGGCVSIDNDPTPERPRTSTDERNVKLVADALEEDRRATCEELFRDIGAKTWKENAQKPTSVACGWATHSP